MTSPDGASGGVEQTPFERLERLTRQLLRVPKKELDARVEQAKRDSKRVRRSS